VLTENLNVNTEYILGPAYFMTSYDFKNDRSWIFPEFSFKYWITE